MSIEFYGGGNGDTAAVETAIASTGFLRGLRLANAAGDATNDITFTAGRCADSRGVAAIMCAGMTKRLDASWTAGDGNGGLDTGSIANATYHCFAIRKGIEGLGDFIFSTDPVAPALPPDYAYYRRIGSVIRSGGTILGFKQRGDEFLLDTPIRDLLTQNPGTAAVLAALTVPAGLKLRALANVLLYNGTSSDIRAYLSDPDQPDHAPTGSLNNLHCHNSAGQVIANVHARVYTNTSRQIRYRFNNSGAADEINIFTLGWTDTRGRDE